MNYSNDSLFQFPISAFHSESNLIILQLLCKGIGMEKCSKTEVLINCEASSGEFNETKAAAF